MNQDRPSPSDLPDEPTAGVSVPIPGLTAGADAGPSVGGGFDVLPSRPAAQMRYYTPEEDARVAKVVADTRASLTPTPGLLTRVSERLDALEARLGPDGGRSIELRLSELYQRTAAIQDRLLEVENTQLAQHERERLGPVAEPLGVHVEALTERRRIVAWLRDRARNALADAIERGEHAKGGGA